MYDNNTSVSQSTGERPADQYDNPILPFKGADTGQQRDIVREVNDRLSHAYNYDRHNRDAAAVDLRFLAGDQWPEFARAARANRPMLTINKLPQFLHQVTNDIRRNAPVLKVTPVGKSDDTLADIYDGIIADIQYRSSARHVYATAGYHAAACGIGHWRVKTEYQDEDTFDQEIKIELIPYPLAVYWDPAAVKPDRSDAMWCIVVDLVPTETFKLKYPNSIPASVMEVRTPTFSTGIFWQTRDYVLVAEYWCKVPEVHTLTAFQSGETFNTTKFNPMQMYQLQQMHGPVVRSRKSNCYRVEQAIVTGAEVLNGPNVWAGKHIPIVPVVGTEIPLERNIVRKGLIRDAMDAQQLYNFYRSAAAEHIALSPKSPWIVTDEMIGRHKNDWNTLNSANKPFIRYTPDPKAPGQMPQRVAAPVPPNALWQEAEIATDDLKATTGIYDASLGAKSNETSGVAIKRREQQGDTANFHYQDNLTLSIEHTGRILVDLIPKIYDNARVVRLLTEGGEASQVQINHVMYDDNGQSIMLNDLSQGRFDIRVTIGPSYQTKRLEAAQSIIELMQALGPNAAPLLADIAVRNMDIPDAEEASARLRAMVPQQAMVDPNAPPPPPDPMQQQAMALQMGIGEAKLQQEQAKATGLQMDNAIKSHKLHGEKLNNLSKTQQILQPPEPDIDQMGGPSDFDADNYGGR